MMLDWVDKAERLCGAQNELKGNWTFTELLATSLFPEGPLRRLAAGWRLSHPVGDADTLVCTVMGLLAVNLLHFLLFAPEKPTCLTSPLGRGIALPALKKSLAKSRAAAERYLTKPSHASVLTMLDEVFKSRHTSGPAPQPPAIYLASKWQEVAFVVAMAIA
jgi:hypothetical protein